MTAAVGTAPLVTEPGVYRMPAEMYFADPVPGGSLSSSAARKLLPPSCPARYRYELDHPPATTAAFDLGHAAHTLVLGDGPEIRRVEANDWRTNKAKEARDAAYADGAVPLLPDDHDQVLAMAAALRAHPWASVLFDSGRGRPEQSLFWVDNRTGVWRRARLDWLPDPRDGRMIVVDYKTCRSAALSAIQKAAYDYGYHQQAAWYLDGVKALGLDREPVFLFVFQEKAAPYLVTVVELDVVALRIGSELNRKAIDIYHRCVESGHWPGYSDDIELIPLPAWAEARHLEENP